MNKKVNDEKAILRRAIVGFALFLLLTPALLFIAAGTLRWPMAWLYVALLLASATGSRLITWRRYPDLLLERARFTAAGGALPADRCLVLAVGLLGPAAIAVVAGLDQRYGWTAVVSPAGQLLAALLVAVGYGLAVWAMIVNRYFSAAARLQPDRGQVVVTAGPYRCVRHPAYAGALLAALALPLQLDAIWALLPALAASAALVVRTRLEDEMLQAGLPGYAAYARRTRYRLVPGLW